MRWFLYLTALLVSLIAAASGVAAQETTPQTPSKNETEEQRKKALELLNLTISEVRALKIPENRT